MLTAVQQNSRVYHKRGLTLIVGAPRVLIEVGASTTQTRPEPNLGSAQTDSVRLKLIQTDPMVGCSQLGAQALCVWRTSTWWCAIWGLLRGVLLLMLVAGLPLLPCVHVHDHHIL